MASQLEKTKKLNKFWTAWNIIEAVALFAAGVLAIVLGATYDANKSNGGNVENAIAYVIGAFVILDGILRVVLHFARYQKGEGESPLVIAGFEITIGILLVLLQIKYTSFMFTVVNFIAVLLISMGTLLLASSIHIIVKKYAKLFMPVMEIFFSAILIGVGITILILYNAKDNNQFIYILAGSVLCIAAIGIFVACLITSSKAKKEVKEAEKEERGDYQIVDASQAKETPKPAEVIEAPEEIPESPEEITGPKAIEEKKEEKPEE